jgi:hypothetical protein
MLVVSVIRFILNPSSCSGVSNGGQFPSLRVHVLRAENAWIFCFDISMMACLHTWLHLRTFCLQERRNFIASVRMLGSPGEMRGSHKYVQPLVAKQKSATERNNKASQRGNACEQRPTSLSNHWKCARKVSNEWLPFMILLSQYYRKQQQQQWHYY